MRFLDFLKELAKYELITHIYFFIVILEKYILQGKVTVSRSGANSEPFQTSMMKLKIVTCFDKKLCIFNPLTTNVPLYRNQSVDLLCKSTDWFLYDGNIGH